MLVYANDSALMLEHFQNTIGNFKVSFSHSNAATIFQRSRQNLHYFTGLLHSVSSQGHLHISTVLGVHSIWFLVSCS